MQSLLNNIQHDLQNFEKEKESLGDSALGMYKNPANDKFYFIKKSKKEDIGSIAQGSSQEQQIINDILTEYLISLIGTQIPSLEVCKYYVGKYNNQLRIFSESFLKSHENLFHGMELFSEAYASDDLESPRHKKYPSIYILSNIKKHLYKFLKSQNLSKKQSYKIYQDFLNMCLWDAVIGNNDRHLQNWGIVTSLQSDHYPYFSPIYDTARSFMWNKTDQKLQSNQVEKYCIKSTPHIGFIYGKKCNHFELVEHILDSHPNIINSYIKIINEFKLIDTDSIISNDPLLSTSICTKRTKIIKEILEYRIQTLDQIISTKQNQINIKKYTKKFSTNLTCYLTNKLNRAMANLTTKTN